MQGLLTQGVSYYVGLPNVVVQTKIIVFQELHPLYLSHVQLLMVEKILQALMVGKHLKLHAIEVMSPYFQGKHYNHQLKVVGWIVYLMGLLTS